MRDKRHPKTSQVPCISDFEWAIFDGLHCHALFRELKRKDWCCPSCKRTLRQCTRWRWISGPSWRARYGNEKGEGWTIGLHRHHDHGGRWSGTVVLCGVCNAADGAIKRKLGLPAEWSFTETELAQILTAIPHGGSTIDYAKAQEIYTQGNAVNVSAQSLRRSRAR